jgi:hypothetical protein
MVWRRAVAVWLVLTGAEIVQGTARRIILTPRVGDERARQIGVLAGSLVNQAIAWRTIGWIGAKTTAALAGIGVMWVALTVLFEVAFGRFVARSSWARIRSDYDLAHGGLLPLGLAAMAAAPLLAARGRHNDRGSRSDRMSRGMAGQGAQHNRRRQ